ELYRPYLKRTKKRAMLCAKSLKDKEQEALKLDLPYYDHAGPISTHDNFSSITDLKTCLYISDKPENFSYIRRNPQLIHVFSGHGDSDKHSSASRVATVYDYVMVADRNAMERFITADVNLRLDQFIMVGGSPI